LQASYSSCDIYGGTRFVETTSSCVAAERTVRNVQISLRMNGSTVTITAITDKQ